ncbi:hypothetical protein [Carboxylicivirga sp. M1479]|uniref:hypothetical protein n=1 Tax=Carboxylicivirga sp. M1479 TaxID=2594476 RepID=UPI001178BE98|nr:hypothetical protein [Carboxylicivirga sp. M1479]TRX72226.1 hypothetical protein FNN09_02315 [Carboxylicivirga sp. M1479]
MKFTFSKVSRHRVFQHDPIYYDEQKEKQEARQRRIKEELGLLSEEEKETGYANRIKGGMRRRLKSHYEVSRSEKKRSNLRLVAILIVLMILGFYLIQEAMTWMETFFVE